MSTRRRTLARMTPITLVAVLAPLLALLSPLASPAVSAATTSTTVKPCATTKSAHYTHVVWIVLENEGYGVIGSSSAP